MKISVVVPTLNEEKYISGILQDLTTQTLKPAETTIVDAHSTDNTLQVVRRFPGVTTQLTHPPVAHQRSLGGKLTSGDILFFFDADVRIDRSFLSDSLKEMQRKKLDIACPKYICPNSLTVNIFLQMLNVLFLILQKVLPSGAGNCIIVKKTVFDKSGGFNSEIQFDDIEFVRRVAHSNAFGIINSKCAISDRRFRKYGYFRTVFTYLALSVFFTFGLFSQTKKFIPYEFGKFSA